MTRFCPEAISTRRCSFGEAFLAKRFLPVVTKPLRSTPSKHLPRLRAEKEEGNGSPTKRKFITREEEPDEYWMSKGEREGANPMSDPLAYIGIIAILAPFIILGVAVAVGYLDLTP